MKAIATIHNGIKYRNETEARWGLYFYMLGVEFQYQKQDFPITSEIYTPDFWLPIPSEKYPDAGYLFEIAMVDPTEFELERCKDLARITKHTVRLIVGPPSSDFKVYTFHHADAPWKIRNPEYSHEDKYLSALGYTAFHTDDPEVPIEERIRISLDHATSFRFPSQSSHVNGAKP